MVKPVSPRTSTFGVGEAGLALKDAQFALILNNEQ